MFFKSFFIMSVLLVLLAQESFVLSLILFSTLGIISILFFKIKSQKREEIIEYVSDRFNNFIEETNIWSLSLGIMSPFIVISIIVFYDYQTKIYSINEKPNVTCHLLSIQDGVTHLSNCSDNNQYYGYKVTLTEKGK